MALNKLKGMNLAQVIELHGTDPATRERTFLMHRDQTGRMQQVSYAEFYRTALAYARMIMGIRREKGKLESPRFHVGFYMQNTPEVVYLLGGCALSNSTLVGINNAQMGQKLATDVNKMDIEAIFVDEAPQPKTGRTFLETVLQAEQRFGLGGLYPDYVIARKRQAKNHPPRVLTIAEKLTQCQGHDFAPIPLQGDNAGVIIFTSGTTGAPKGIEVLWDKVFDVGLVSSTLLNYTENDVGYICMPLNHSNSLYLTLLPALLNSAKVLLRRRFSATGFLADISEAGATVWNSVGDPVMYVLNRLGPDADYAHLPLRTVVSTGTSAANRAAFTRIFGLEIFAEAYGSTEVGAVALVTPDTPDYSVGRVIEGKDLRILDEAGSQERQAALVDQAGNITNFAQAVGEIVVSQASLGASAFSSYYNMPLESTARVDENGFYRMGDLGAIEERASGRYVIFLGRTGSDRLRNKGENFAATFVEEIILGDRWVNNCAVIGIPYVDNIENDNPMYVLEVDDPADFDLAGFLDFCRQEIPHYALPGFVRLLEELPRTDTRKVKKAALLKEFIERTLSSDSSGQDLLYRVGPDGPSLFRRQDYLAEMARCIDPAVRSRFIAVTKRNDIFKS